MKPSLSFGATEWSTDWSASAPQNQLSWGTWEAPVLSPPPVVAKTSFSKSFVPIQPPASVPGAAFVPVMPNSNDSWTPVAPVVVTKPVIVPVLQSPPVVTPSSFVDVTDNSSWTVPSPTNEEQPHELQVPPPQSSPQRAIKLRQQGGNIEAELRQQDLYKTEYCRSWRETGACRYGNKCQFAHGEHELRPVLRHPKYKTEVCRNFSETGTCPYGTRCRFVHYQRGRSVGSNDGAETEGLAVDLETLTLDNAAPVPAEETKEKSKGSRLPFFQKLRRNTSSDKEKDTSKGR